jgi:hypothetical protein
MSVVSCPLHSMTASHATDNGPLTTDPLDFYTCGYNGGRTDRGRNMRQRQEFDICWIAAIVIAAALHGVGVAAEPRALDVPRLSAAGVRVLDGKYVRILTDLPSSPAVDELPTVFDAAVPLWAEYFRVPAAKLVGARWQACLIVDREQFAALGLMPANNREFVNGYAESNELWLMEQPSDYYRRHLLLHEGTHAFMHAMLGGCGPGWYMEGTAELLGTHQWKDGRLTLGIFPTDKDDVPMWGRIKLIRDAVKAGKAWSLEQVLAIDNSREMSTDEYAWAWALAAMLHNNPRYGYLGLSQEIPKQSDLTVLFQVGAMGRWGILNMEWQTFLSQLNYGGYDFKRMEIDVARPSPVIHVDRGWQPTDKRVSKGKSYRIMATGRYKIAGGDEPWMCEPGGVTIEYHDGKPLGMLLGAFPGRGINDEGSCARPLAIGLETTITPDRDGWLFLRVNESPTGLADNRGELTVRIEEVDRKLAPGQ